MIVPTLYSAIKKNDLSALKEHIDHGIDLDEALRYAASTESTQAIELLVASGANIESIDENGNSPLMEAAFSNKPKALQTLISLGANINAINFRGKSALAKATKFQATACVDILLANGAIPLVADQGTFIAKLIKYYDNASKVPKEKVSWIKTLTDEGECNGLAFFFQYYLAKNRVDLYFAMIDVINKADTDEDIPDCLKAIGFKNKHEVIDYFSSQMMYFQNDLKLLNPRSHLDRKIFYDINKTEKDPTLHEVVEYHSLKFFPKDIASFIDFIKKTPGVSVDITLADPRKHERSKDDVSNKNKFLPHAVTLKVLEDGSIVYYDSNFTSPPFSTTSADTIQKLINESLEILQINNGYISDIGIYQFLNEGSPAATYSLDPKDIISPFGKCIFETALKNNDLDLVRFMINTIRDYPQANEYRKGLYSAMLIKAVKDKNVSVIKKFLEAGADPEFCHTDGLTPLMLAVQEDDVLSIQALLEGGAKVNTHDDTGFTALMMASATKHEKALEVLLENGANSTLTSDTGVSALSIAEKLQYEPVKSLLQQYQLKKPKEPEAEMETVHEVIQGPSPERR